MAQVRFPTAAWIQAATLRERVARLRARASPAIDAELGQRELESWRAQVPFDRGEYFARRLAIDSLDAPALAQLLGEQVQGSTEERTPSWVTEIEQAYGDEAHSAPWSIEIEGASEAAKTLRFLDVIEPLIRRGRDRVLHAARVLIANLERAPFDPDVATSALLTSLPWNLHARLARAMVLELNIARIEQRLAGATPEERFEDFVRRLRSPANALAFLADYPVLARSVVHAIDQWVRFGIEFLTHLVADWEALQRTFSADSAPGRLAHIDGGAGDAHRDGRSVLVAQFESGLRVVYKPRSLAVDVHFQQLLAWINERGDQPAFRRLSVLDRGDHGWAEFVVAHACNSRDEVRRFYRRQGGLVALLYALEAIDFHFENLIAAGEDPVLVDLESLFHARIGREETSEPDLRLVSHATARSVLRIGILPQKSFAGDGYVGVDLSGLASAEGQLTPDRVLQWDDLATDSMHARRERVAMPGGRNLPQLLGSDSSVIHFKEDLAHGFAEIYRLLARHRDELLAPDGPLARFALDEVRCVLRATRVYGVLLAESQHPDYQRDGLELERFLDRVWAGIEDNPHLLPIVQHERSDLANGDIPMFVTRPDSRDLSSASGVRIPDVLETSGLELVRERVRALDEDDLRRQLWFVQASLATLEISRASFEWTTYPRVTVESRPERASVQAELHDNALRIGDRLIELALRDERDVAWMGLQYDDRSWSLVPLLEDLYSGVSGVIHFLAYLGHVSGTARYTEVACAALATYRRRLDFVSPLVRVVGAFNGWGGAVYVLSHWSRLWNQPELAAQARSIAGRMAELLDEDEHLDIIGGSAGLIGALSTLHAVAPDDGVLQLARRAGDRLVARARRMERGSGWFTRIETELPITGFSHGAAGIAWALCELHRLTGDERYRASALDAILYERTRLIEREGNWLEISKDKLAQSPEERRDGALSVAWCYGAPGVGLARLHSLATLDHPFVREDVDIALKTTLARGFGRNHSLCHGDLGNLDFVIQAADLLADARLAAAALHIEATVLASMRASGWLCGVPLGVESPSLMNGLAGIGYGLLRAAHPDRVPSVLVLEPPRA